MKVILTGDFHIGIRGVDVDVIKDVAKKYWRGKKVVLLGDLIDCGIDRGMQYDNILKPQEQIDVLKPLLKELDIIGYVNGNHENRYYKTNGIDILKTIMDKPVKRKIDIRGRKLFINHGRSVAQNIFGEFEKYTRFYDANVYVLGHNHELAYKSMLYNGNLRYYVRSGTFMSTTRYTEGAGYPPKIPGWAEYDTIENYITLWGIINKGVRKI